MASDLGTRHIKERKVSGQIEANHETPESDRERRSLADGSIDAALRFLERTEQTIKGLAIFPESGAPFATRGPELAGMRTKLVKEFPNRSVIPRAG